MTNVEMSQNFTDLWKQVMIIIRDIIGPDKFECWFSAAKPLDYNRSNGELSVELPSMYFKDLYESTFYDVIKKALRRVFGHDVSLIYVVPVVQGDATATVHLKENHKSEIAVNKSILSAQGPARPEAGVRYADVDSQLNPTYNFENYCIGESNHLPVIIAQTIADYPERTEFNPFFLYGDVGVGKTHLIQAIGLRLKQKNPHMRILYVPYRFFQNQLQAAVIKKSVPDFVNWYSSIEVLLIDDIQEMSFKDGTMNQLFPIFNHLHQHGRKLIFTCDRPPVELDGVTDRLIDRFKWGVVEKLPRPDFELRKKILRFKADKNGLNLPDEVIETVARDAEGSVRQLEGIVMGIYTNAIAHNAPITVDLAREVMRRTVKIERHTINFDMIVESTADYYHLNPDVIFTKSRVRDIADARQLIMYLAHKHTKLSSPVIGAKLNRRHATVLYGIKTIEERLPFSKDLSDAVAAIESDLKHL